MLPQIKGRERGPTSKFAPKPRTEAQNMNLISIWVDGQTIG